MRIPLIAGNWKMHGSESQVNLLINGIKQGALLTSNIEILVFPPYLYIPQVRELLTNTRIHFGAQNLYLHDQGAFTGEISGPMLQDLGCEYVLIGHSERRDIFQEDLALIADKFKAVLHVGLKPILCVGETKVQRENAQTETILEEQITSILKAAGIDAFRQAVIAYEPVWAIGTGLTASPEQAQEAHSFIRQLLAQNNVDIARTIRILYGGSMKPENAASLLAKPDIDGGLIGGASLDVASFLAICAAANQTVAMGDAKAN